METNIFNVIQQSSLRTNSEQAFCFQCHYNGGSYLVWVKIVEISTKLIKKVISI